MSTRQLTLYRMEGGVRVAYRFTVDERMTILAEQKDPRVKPEKPSAPSRLGVVVEKQEDGSRVVTQVDQATQQALQFLVSDDPCDFPGCNGLREEYREALARLPSDCPQCRRGDVIRKYLQRVKDGIENQK